MSFDDLTPPGDALRRAIRWISEVRVEHPERAMHTIVDEAGPRFNLTPAQSQALLQTFAPSLPTPSSPARP